MFYLQVPKEIVLKLKDFNQAQVQNGLSVIIFCEEISKSIQKYTNAANAGSFSGISGFKKNNQLDVKDLQNFEPYSLHKQVKRKFQRRKTIVKTIGK